MLSGKPRLVFFLKTLILSMLVVGGTACDDCGKQAGGQAGAAGGAAKHAGSALDQARNEHKAADEQVAKTKQEVKKATEDYDAATKKAAGLVTDGKNADAQKLLDEAKTKKEDAIKNAEKAEAAAKEKKTAEEKATKQKDEAQKKVDDLAQFLKTPEGEKALANNKDGKDSAGMMDAMKEWHNNMALTDPKAVGATPAEQLAQADAVLKQHGFTTDLKNADANATALGTVAPGGKAPSSIDRIQFAKEIVQEDHAWQYFKDNPNAAQDMTSKPSIPGIDPANIVKTTAGSDGKTYWQFSTVAQHPFQREPTKEEQDSINLMKPNTHGGDADPSRGWVADPSVKYYQANGYQFMTLVDPNAPPSKDPNDPTYNEHRGQWVQPPLQYDPTTKQWVPSTNNYQWDYKNSVWVLKKSQ